MIAKNGVFLIGAVLLTACQSPVSQSNLYWGDYSSTLYQVKKEPGEESIEAHRMELLEIIEESKQRNLRVPPGVYAELGVIAMEKGEEAEAKGYFNLEIETYPESSVLLQRITSGE